MDDIDYKSNSNKSKIKDNDILDANNEHKIQKVTTGRVITKKKNGFQKFADEFISEDAKNIKTYVFGEVLIPAIKKALSDIIIDGINILLYGDARTGRSRSTADKVSYRSYYDRDSSYRRDESRSMYNSYSYDDIILDSRGEAEDVLSRMDELIESYGLVRVADLYDLVGITGNYTDNKYGWTNIRNAQIVRVRDGYMIKMPRAIPID